MVPKIRLSQELGDTDKSGKSPRLMKTGFFITIMREGDVEYIFDNAAIWKNKMSDDRTRLW